MTGPTFVTLGPTGTCHENAVRRFIAFLGVPGASIRLADDFLSAAEIVRDTPNSFLVQSSAHPDVHLVTERFRHQLYVIDSFLHPAREMALVARADVERPRTLAVVGAARGYVDTDAFDEVISEPANPVVWQGLLEGRYDAGVTIHDFVAGHEDRFRVIERFGIVDTSWVVFGRERRGDGSVIAQRQPWLYSGDPAPQQPLDGGDYPGVTVGDGYAVGHLSDLGCDYGFRKVRRALGVTAFGVNALVRKPGHQGSRHRHAAQEELYFVHRGALDMRFADGTVHRIDEGGFARVDASTVRQLTTVAGRDGEDVVYLCAGGADGYVGRDGIPSEWPEGHAP
jgi:hypothetical protein